MDEWGEIDKRHGLKSAAAEPVSDPWAAIDAKHLTMSPGQVSTLDKPNDRSMLRQVTDKAGAFASGFNRAYLSRAGLPFNPVDVAANVVDLGKAAVSTPLMMAGMTPQSWMDLTPRGQVPLSGEWLVNQARKTSLGRAALDAPNSADDGGMYQAVGGGAGFGGRGALAMGAASAGAGKYVTDATGNQSFGALASMAPMAAKVGAVAGAQKLATPADPRRTDLARTAIEKYEIPLGLSDTTGSKMVKATRSIMNDTVGLAAIGGAQDAAKQQAFNRAIGKKIGVDENSLPPDVMQGAKSGIQGRLNEIWNNNALVLDAPMMQAIQSVRARAADKLMPEQAAQVEKMVQNLLAKAENGAIPGAYVNNWQSEMRMIADGEKGLHQAVLGDLRKAAIQGFNRSVSGDEADALGTARSQYGAFKTIEPLMAKGEAGMAGRVSGDVPAGLLPQRVVQQYGNNVRNSPFAELSPIAGQFLTDRVGRTGGDMRAMLQNTLVGGGLLSGTAAFGAPVVAASGAAGSGALQYLLGNANVNKYLLDKKTKPITVDDLRLLSNMPGMLGNYRN